MSFTDKPVKEKIYNALHDGPKYLWVTEVGTKGHIYRQEWPSKRVAMEAIRLILEKIEDGRLK